MKIQYKLELSRNKKQFTHNPKSQDTRYDLPRPKIKDTGGGGEIFIPKRLHKDSTHLQTKRNDFPLDWPKLPPPTSDPTEDAKYPR